MKALEILCKYRHEALTCDPSDYKEASEINDAIAELEALQQHIKSLEAQLANTEQLTCDKCLFWKDYRKCPMADHEDVAPKSYCYNFYPKDTQ